MLCFAFARKERDRYKIFLSRWLNFFLVHMADKGAPEMFSPMHNVVGCLGYARKSRESVTLDTSWNSVE